MCFCYRIPAPLVLGVPTKTRLESSMKKFKPLRVYFVIAFQATATPATPTITAAATSATATAAITAATTVPSCDVCATAFAANGGCEVSPIIAYQPM